jgi:hypothetical protein
MLNFIDKFPFYFVPAVEMVLPNGPEGLNRCAPIITFLLGQRIG